MKTKMIVIAIFVLVLLVFGGVLIAKAQTEICCNQHLHYDAGACTKVHLTYYWWYSEHAPVLDGTLDEIGNVLISCPFPPYAYQANSVITTLWNNPSAYLAGKAFYVFEIPGAGYHADFRKCTVFAGVRYGTEGRIKYLDSQVNTQYRCPNILAPFIIKDVWGMMEDPPWMEGTPYP